MTRTVLLGEGRSRGDTGVDTLRRVAMGSKTELDEDQSREGAAGAGTK